MTADSRIRALVTIARFLAERRGRKTITDTDRADAQVLYERLAADAVAWQAEAFAAGPVLHAVKDEASR